MGKIRKIAMLARILGMSAQEHFMYSEPELRRYNPDYKVKSVHRVLREFTVNGKKVMAFSKKDAIKRLKHI